MAEPGEVKGVGSAKLCVTRGSWRDAHDLAGGEGSGVDVTSMPAESSARPRERGLALFVVGAVTVGVSPFLPWAHVLFTGSYSMNFSLWSIASLAANLHRWHDAPMILLAFSGAALGLAWWSWSKKVLTLWVRLVASLLFVGEEVVARDVRHAVMQAGAFVQLGIGASIAELGGIVLAAGVCLGPLVRLVRGGASRV